MFGRIKKAIIDGARSRNNCVALMKQLESQLTPENLQKISGRPTKRITIITTLVAVIVFSNLLVVPTEPNFTLNHIKTYLQPLQTVETR